MRRFLIVLVLAFGLPGTAGAGTLFLIDGRGWGHGVGMCQWCAAGWSQRGMKYTEILKKSYPGATLVKAY